MKRVSSVLTDYVIHKGMVEEKDREMYKYGFTVALEFSLFAVFCIFMALYLDMPVEGIIFFIIFSPLRSYAGGLHLESFQACFALSCLTYSAVLTIIKYIQIPALLSFTILITLELLVYALYPVEHINREVDEEENRYFKKKFIKFLCFDTIVGVICLALKKEKILVEIVIIFSVIVITMTIEQYLNTHGRTGSKKEKS